VWKKKSSTRLNFIRQFVWSPAVGQPTEQSQLRKWMIPSSGRLPPFGTSRTLLQACKLKNSYLAKLYSQWYIWRENQRADCPCQSGGTVLPVRKVSWSGDPGNLSSLWTLLLPCNYCHCSKAVWNSPGAWERQAGGKEGSVSRKESSFIKALSSPLWDVCLFLPQPVFTGAGLTARPLSPPKKRY